MHIVIHPKARRILIFLAIVIVISAAAFAIHNAFFPSTPVQTQTVPPDQSAAVDGAIAFYTLDYTESADLWATRVCARSTEAGCEAIKNFYAQAVRATVEKYQVQSGCAVQALRLIADKGDIQVWEIEVTMNNPWEGLKTPTQDVYIEVANVDGQWLMNRILFDQEKQLYPTPVTGDSKP